MTVLSYWCGSVYVYKRNVLAINELNTVSVVYRYTYLV